MTRFDQLNQITNISIQKIINTKSTNLCERQYKFVQTLFLQSNDSINISTILQYIKNKHLKNLFCYVRFIIDYEIEYNKNLNHNKNYNIIKSFLKNNFKKFVIQIKLRK